MQTLGMMGAAAAPAMSRGPARPPGPGTSSGGDHPIRPGEPDCQFFLKTGNCKFGESCKFNHPPEKTHSAFEHPVREGVADCSFYIKTGQCRFGSSCKYNHPPQGGAVFPAGRA